MSRLLRFVAYVAAWLIITISGGLLGTWWPIRNVPEPWAGDGIGVLVFGFVGLLAGAVFGVFALGAFAVARSRRSSLPEAQQRAAGDVRDARD
jgi:hypothetical protein